MDNGDLLKSNSPIGDPTRVDRDDTSTAQTAHASNTELSEVSSDDDQLFLDKTYIPPIKYDYLDHTADIQLHSWGDNLKEAFEQVAVCMYGLLTNDLSTVEMKEIQEVSVQEDDMLNLLFHFLDELLFLFCADPFLIGRKVHISKFDPENFSLTARVFGEPFEIGKHPQGCDIKAITYSNMQVHLDSNQIFVIVDI